MSDAPVDTADPVLREVQQFDEVVTTARVRLVERIEQDLVGLIAASARAAADEHAAILRNVGAQPSDESSAGADRDRARAYRREVSTRVIQPLHDLLAGLDIGETLVRWQEEIGSTLSAAAAGVPREVVRTEPRETYAAAEDDALLRRVRKKFVRVRRGASDGGRKVLHAARSLGRRSRPASERTQTVPLAHLLGYHAEVRLASATGSALEGLRTRLAAPIADLERSLALWFHLLLGLDESGDRRATAAPVSNVAPDDEASAAAGGQGVDPERTLDEAAAALTLALESLTTCELLAADFATALQEHFGAARDPLLVDLTRAGTFMLDSDARTVRTPGRAARAAAESEALWIRWYRESVARIELNLELERFQREVRITAEGLVRTVAVEVIDPVEEILRTTRDSIAALRNTVKQACDDAREDNDAEALASAIAAAFDSVRDRLTRGVSERLDDRSYDRRARAAAEACIGEITGMLGALPATLEMHEPPSPGQPTLPDAKPVRVRLRRVAEQAYDAVLLERLHTAPRPVTTALDRIRTEVRQLGSVVRFSLDSSLAELAGADESDARLEGAEELALNGIDRTVHTLGELHSAWLAELPALALHLHETNDRGWSQLYDRVRVEDRGQEQLLDFRYRVRSAVRDAADATFARGRRGFRYGTRLARVGRGRAQELIRLGQSAVEGSVITDDERRRTLEALYTIDESVAALPLVYRRLFSFQPVSDPDLLEGRSLDLEAIERHFAEWRVGITDAFVLTGFDGNGRTSFLNIVQETILHGADVRRISFPERLLDESELAQYMARALDIPADEPPDLDTLAQRILTAPPPDTPVACLLENVEHLLLRTSQGNGLVGVLLTFMSRLDSQIFWLATLSESAWKYIATVEDGAARLVRRQALSQLTSADLQAAISKRHLRSGLGLVFDAPRTQSPIMKRRLGRARDEAERQEILRADFFDRLFRYSGQNLLLAMFYWIRSVSLDTAESTIHVKSLAPLSFGYIEYLPLEYSFALKAFLDHATLTPAEYDRIFQGSGSNSRHIFETLGNLLILERADSTDQPSQFTFTTIEEGARYRIRPLLVHPVLVTLRARNIVT